VSNVANGPKPQPQTERAPVLFLREKIRWMGTHSGYDPICDAVMRARPGPYRAVQVRGGARAPFGFASVLGQLRKRAQGSPFYSVNSVRAEIEALVRCRFQRTGVLHSTYVENQLGWIPRLRSRVPARLVGTVHQPPGWYRLRHRHVEQLAALDAVIVLGSRASRYFEEIAPGRVFFIPYAVDLEFFRPGKQAAEQSPRCFFGGKWLRDWDTLVPVIERVLERHSTVQFDLLVPKDARADGRLLRLARHDRVHWHAGVSDAALLALYQRADLLLLPMLDCVGNSVLVEAIACGLPVVASDVGALRDYCEPSFATLTPAGEVAPMVDAVLALLDDPEERRRRSSLARAFAEKRFSWQSAAQQTLAVYDRVLETAG